MTDEMTSGADISARDGGPGLGHGGRMSRQRKMAAVLRLLRGEDLELVSRSLGVTAATLSGWRDEFLAGGVSLALASQALPTGVALKRRKARRSRRSQQMRRPSRRSGSRRSSGS